MRYCIMNDGDGHYYIVPSVRKAMFQTWLDLVSNAQVAYQLPEYAKPIDGPHVLTFTDPRDDH